VFLVVPPGGNFRETRRIELGARALTLGRAEKCDIRVDVPGVDDEHCKISEVALIAIGPDCAIGDVPLDPGCRRLITPGDEIQIGSVVVALEGDDPTAPPPDAAQELPALGHTRPEGPRVRVVEGQSFGEELVLKDEGREYVVGRGPKCDLVLEDREVSREHIRLLRRGYVVYIKDLGSTRGSWLGRSSVYTGSTIEWTRPRMLRLGATVLSLELPDAIRKAAPPPLASAPMTPEPRSIRGMNMPNPASTPVMGGGPPGMPPLVRSEPPPAVGVAAAPSAPPGRVHQYSYDPTPPPMPVALPSAPPSSLAAVSSSPKRAGWKKAGPTLGKGTGVLLLAFAAVVVLGALFVVFSLLE
jgi:pSer/pThr/pTyr-binding forkhead associated (FHA) protein